jgi:hypothetical protein
MTQDESAVARQYTRLLEAKEAADKLWVKVDRETMKLVKLAKIGRKRSAVVKISDTHGLEISNQFKGEEKVFAPAFARKWKLKEVRLD